MYKTFEEFLANKEIKTKASRKWGDMKNRCYNPNNKDYAYYGAKGIKVCDEWLKDKMKFFEWLYKNKYYTSKDKMSIDRIDSSKGYEPSNCRLVSIDFNTRYIKGLIRNKCKYSNTNLYFKAGQSIKFETIKARNRAGWDEERIINTPVQFQKRTIGCLRQALKQCYNKDTFYDYVIKFHNQRNINPEYKDTRKECLEIIKEYKKLHPKKRAKTAYMEKYSTLIRRETV